MYTPAPIERPNRTDHAAFLHALDDAIASATAAQEMFAILLIQVRDFGRINRSLGYAAGDMTIAWVASQLHEGFEGNVQIVRVGDARFALLLNGLTSVSFAILAAHKAERLLNRPIAICGQSINIEISQGIAVYPEQAHQSEPLLLCAESALRCSLGDESRSIVYEDTEPANRSSAVHLEGVVSEAMADGGIEVHFQPQVNLHSLRPVGAEALLRCRDDLGTYLPPELVVETALRMRRLSDVTFSVLNASLRHAAQWSSRQTRHRVSVNVSPPTLKHADFVDIVTSALRIWDVQPDQLTIEITESAFMVDPEQSFEVMRELREHGVRIAIDDFGTGYSSLAYFKNIPANELKIDKSFVFNVVNDEADQKLVRTVGNLAQEFGLEVVAEGVENENMVNLLADLGCHIGQGYLFGRPMTPASFADWLDAQYRE